MSHHTSSQKALTKPQVALIVLDGWGYREDTTHNAVAASHKPYFDSLWKSYPHALLDASGLAVGLPEGQMGNSEIGHTTIGAGKIIDTDLVRIKKSIDSGEFANNPAFLALFKHVKEHDSVLHIQGLLSDGGVHSHQEHLFAFLKAARAAGITKIAIHAFTDGRDTAPQSASGYLKDLEKVLAEVGIGRIATVSGRFYAMDRDNNWDRLARVEDALFECKGSTCSINPSTHIESLYTEGKLDEHIEPIVFLDEEGRSYAIKDNDGVFFFNFRADRARMLSKKMMERQAKQNICFATLTEYGSEFKCLIAFPPTVIETTLAAELSSHGFTQAHIAETEKFPHATYFLNGGREKPHDGEKHILLASRKDVATHDLAPKMRAEGIADKALEEVEAGTDFIFINFANPDMVGHTANVPAIIEAVEEVDRQLKRVTEALLARGGIVLVTADHGNAEMNVDQETGEKHTAHTINPVPVICATASPSYPADTTELKNGTLADLTPTVLSIFGIKIPKTMSGSSLIKN